jgi:kynurenine formamidase
MGETETLDLGRRGFLASAAIAAAASGLALSSAPAGAEPVNRSVSSVRFGGNSLRFADLTHRLTRQFNFDPTHPRIDMQSVDGSGVAVGMKMHRLLLIEHTGTHLDAPSHFGSEFKSVGDLPLSDLVVPLAVISIADRAAQSRNAQLEPDDVLRWEGRHGRLPAGCCVAMDSGSDPLARPELRASDGKFASTGFSPEAAKMLAQSRDVKGIAVDAMTIDSGPHVPSYPVHQFWLRSGRWGVEGITNLSAVPASGALLIVGAAPIADATGIPIRALALF